MIARSGVDTRGATRGMKDLGGGATVLDFDCESHSCMCFSKLIELYT